MGGILAVDSCGSAGNAHITRVSKLLELDGRHFAISGDMGHVAGFCRDLVAGRHWEAGLADGAGVPVELLSNHRLRVYSGRGFVDVEPTSFYATGSGSEAALGAMYAGAQLMDCMRAAAKVDAFTVGPFHAVRYDDADQKFVTWSTQ